MTRTNIFRSAFFWVPVLLVLAGGLALSRAPAQGACYPDALGVTGADLVAVHDIYGLLERLQAADCLPLAPEVLSAYSAEANLNIVSFALLENQAQLDDAARLSPNMIADYIQKYTATAGEADPGLLLTLADISVFQCQHDEACTGMAIRSYLGATPLSAAAACFYGMNDVCQPELAANVPLLNLATLGTLPPSAQASQTAFLCARYLICN